MAVIPQTPIKQLRLNPFAFPSDTTFRFALLIVFVTATSIYIYTGLPFGYPSELHDRENQIRKCFQASHQVLDPANLDLFVSALSGCLQPLTSNMILWTMGGITIVLGLAVLIYWNYPTFKIRKNKLIPLCNEDLPEIVNDLTEFCQEAKQVPFRRLPSFRQLRLLIAQGLNDHKERSVYSQ